MAEKPGDSSNKSPTKQLGPNPRMAKLEAQASPLFPCGGRVYVQAHLEGGGNCGEYNSSPDPPPQQEVPLSYRPLCVHSTEAGTQQAINKCAREREGEGERRGKQMPAPQINLSWGGAGSSSLSGFSLIPHNSLTLTLSSKEGSPGVSAGNSEAPAGQLEPGGAPSSSLASHWEPRSCQSSPPLHWTLSSLYHIHPPSTLSLPPPAPPPA